MMEGEESDPVLRAIASAPPVAPPPPRPAPRPTLPWRIPAAIPVVFGVLAVALVLLQFAGRSGQALETWTLDVDGGPHDVAVTLPSSLRAELGLREVSYRLRTVVELAPEQRGHDLTLAMDGYLGPVELSVDGAHVANVGNPAPGEHRYAITAAATARATITVELHATHDVMTVLGYPMAPRLVIGEAGASAIARYNRYVNVFAFAVAFLLAIVYVVLFAYDRARKEYLAVAVQAFAGCSVPLYNLGFIGTGGFVAIFELGVVSNLGALYFLHLTFELGPPRRAWLVAFGGVMLIQPFAWLSLPVVLAVSTVNQVITSVLWGALVASYLSLAREPRYRVDAGLMASAYLVLLIAVTAIVAWTATGINVLRGAAPLPTAITYAVVIQMVVLVRQHVARQDTIEHTNRELQRQVAERSKQLADALTELAHRPATLAPKQTLDDRYRVVRHLGTGGMGSVYEVERLADGTRLALKTLRGRADPAAMARLAREAHVAAEISHPNLVPVIDIGIADGAPYFVMPIVDGGSLERARERFGDARWARPLLAQIASGLAALHARGIVHRDLKPANILVERNVARIADFGLAALRATDDAHAALADTVAGLTRGGDVFGTPRYMAPEMVAGVQAAGPATDMFSFGVLAYELLTGSQPHDHAPVLERLAGRTPAPPASLAKLMPELPTDVCALVERCLDAADARPSANEVATALAQPRG